VHAPALSWQKLLAARRSAEARWPSPFRLPLVHRPTDVLHAGLRGTERVLDVGAGDATRRERIAARFPGVTYVSVDPDPEARADHRTVGEAPGTFDAALLLEVLEHMRPEDAVAVLGAVRGKLRPGGLVFVSVPCIHTPGRYLRDCTHVTPWAHDELGGALVLAGFELLALHRTYPGTFLGRAVRRVVLGPVGHLFGLDYAHSVVATGGNPG
jgi:SAM-dependent methyltransferase